MKKTNKILLRVDDQLLELIKNADGNNTTEKCRNLIMKALNVKPTYNYTQGEN